jgi:two-component system, NtrC family, sensor kinase
MKRIVQLPFGGRLLFVLIASFALIAVLAVGLNAVVTSRLISQYLLNAQTDRLNRDLDLANGFYQQKLNDVMSLSQFVALDTQTRSYLPSALNSVTESLQTIDQVVSRMITGTVLNGTRMVVFLDPNGKVLDARSVTVDGVRSPAFTGGDWSGLPVVARALASGNPISSTEVIPAEYLADVDLETQAHILPEDTPKANPTPFDSREGTAALAIVGIYPLPRINGQSSGVVMTAYLFNNDFTFVDYIKNEAKVETMTIFLGDLRVSTNVTGENGGRAVGTRAAQDVYQKVLVQGRNYSGRVFVVNNWYIGSYEPLRDFQDDVVGMMYVGVRETIFDSLMVAFNARAAWIAFVCILVAALIAIPIARLIARPIAVLVEANRRLAKGDMNVRVETKGKGEIALLGRSFNTMVETLRESEKELLHQAKLASVGQLAAGVAHELNNPLGTILLYSDMMYKETPDDDPRKEDLKMILTEVQRCKTIVGDLLNFARQHEIMVQDVNLPSLLDEVIRKVKTRPRNEKVEFDRRYDPNLPVLQADSAQLQQVFVNLFNNSAYAMENTGTITISACPGEDGTVEIKVADTGSGIPAEHLSKLFTPFFTTKPSGKGTGLGLSIVYGIIKLHHGQISIQSQVGQGTTVTISLPVRQPDGGSAQTSASKDIIG